MTTQTSESRTTIARAAAWRWSGPSRLLFAGVVVVLLAFALVPSRLIEARDVSSGDVLGCGQAMTLRFTHSMFGGDVSETYRASPSGVERMRLVTELAAAAEYYVWTEEVERVEDGFEVRVTPQAFDEIVILVDKTGSPNLIVGDADRVLDLRALVGDGGRVRLRSRVVTPIERLFAPC